MPFGEVPRMAKRTTARRGLSAICHRYCWVISDYCSSTHISTHRETEIFADFPRSFFFFFLKSGPVQTGRPPAGGRGGWQEDSNIQPFRWFPPRLPLSFFPSWIPPAVCSVCHSPRPCDARYHITPHPHVNHVNRRLVIRVIPPNCNENL